MSLLAQAWPALASTDGLYLPQSPTGPGGEDSIETAEGTRCRQSMSNNNAYVDMGVVGRSSRNPSAVTNSFYGNETGDTATAYARVTIPLGKKPGRLDCTRLYDMEIQRLKREIELLKLNAQ